MSILAFQNPSFEKQINASNKGNELSRLISAAVVNKRFCQLLLSDPSEALATGFNGELFHLAREEQDLILSIRAVSLADFAMQLVTHQNRNTINGNGNGSGIWGMQRVHQKV